MAFTRDDRGRVLHHPSRGTVTAGRSETNSRLAPAYPVFYRQGGIQAGGFTYRPAYKERCKGALNSQSSTPLATPNPMISMK